MMNVHPIGAEIRFFPPWKCKSERKRDYPLAAILIYAIRHNEMLKANLTKLKVNFGYFSFEFLF
ncbi:hypothetical protein DRO37_08590 [Candidatus Bathyarchaeota archaeon]|nr:MAG: hypothetical protein DRO37_08590 [Candidatus Bathyarchaeota archaeon]